MQKGNIITSHLNTYYHSCFKYRDGMFNHFKLPVTKDYDDDCRKP